MVIGIKWFHFIVSFLRDAPSFFRTTGAGKWLRAFGDPSHQASFYDFFSRLRESVGFQCCPFFEPIFGSNLFRNFRGR